MTRSSVGWPAHARLEKKRGLREALVECVAALDSSIAIPLNVSCSDVVRGVLNRHGGSMRVQGTARVHRRNREFHSGHIVVPQLKVLASALELTIHEIDTLPPAIGVDRSVLRYLYSAREQLQLPSPQKRFPNRFFDLEKDSGYCGEIFICDKSDVVFSLHAYQDNHRGSYKATDTVSVKFTDVGLLEIWKKLDVILREDYS